MLKETWWPALTSPTKAHILRHSCSHQQDQWSRQPRNGRDDKFRLNFKKQIEDDNVNMWILKVVHGTCNTWKWCYNVCFCWSIRSMFLISVLKYKRIEDSLCLTNKRKTHWNSKLVWPSVNTNNGSSMSSRLTVFFGERRVGKALDIPAQSVPGGPGGSQWHLLHYLSQLEAQLTRKAFYFGPKKDALSSPTSMKLFMFSLELRWCK